MQRNVSLSFEILTAICQRGAKFIRPDGVVAVCTEGLSSQAVVVGVSTSPDNPNTLVLRLEDPTMCATDQDQDMPVWKISNFNGDTSR